LMCGSVATIARRESRKSQMFGVAELRVSAAFLPRINWTSGSH
jgi:hypothetical protein